MKNTKLKVFLLVLVLVITNIVTGAIVFQVKNKEFISLKNSIQSTITQKLKVQDELEAYKNACPNVKIDE